MECSCSDGVLAEPIHFTGGHVHRQLRTDRERRTDPLQPRVRLSEYDPHPQDHAGTPRSLSFASFFSYSFFERLI